MLVYEALDIDNENVARMIEKRTLLRRKLRKAWNDMENYSIPEPNEELIDYPNGNGRQFLRITQGHNISHEELSQDPEYEKLTNKWMKTKKEFNRIETRIAIARRNLRIPNHRNRKMSRKSI